MISGDHVKNSPRVFRKPWGNFTIRAKASVLQWLWNWWNCITAVGVEASYSRSNESRHRFGSGCFNPTLTVVEKNMDDEYFYVENLAGEKAMTQSDGFA